MTKDSNDTGPLLSAYGDGELERLEEARVEALLAADPRLALRLADQRALSAALRESLQREADEIDFSGFADSVIARLPKQFGAREAGGEQTRESPATRTRGLNEALPRAGALRSLARRLGSIFEQRRFQLVLGAATAAVVALVTVPFFVEQGPLLDYRIAVREPAASPLPPGLLLAGDVTGGNVLSVEAAADYETMLFKTSAGTTIIFVQEAQ